MAAIQSKSVAESLMSGLGKDFTFPVTDLSSSQFEAPSAENSEFSAGPDRVDVEKLTSGLPGGSGTYDVIMSSNKAHLKEQYEKGLITGEEYNRAYIELTVAALTSAVEFTLQKDTSFWQAKLVQMQGRKAELESVTARVQLEIAKAELAAAQRQAELINAQYVLTQLQISKTDAEFRLTEEQILTEQSRKLTQDSQTHVNNKQADLLHEQGCHEEVKKNLTNHQIAMTQEQTEAQRAQTMDTRRDGTPVSGILRRQKDNLEKEILVKDSQITLVSSQVNLVEEQVEAQRGQTLDTRRDGVPITGMLGKQKLLYAEQIESYKKDAAQKVGKMWLDAFTVQKTMDEGLPVPSEFTQEGINTVLAAVRLKNL